jgi:heat shock protein HtpX
MSEQQQDAAQAQSETRQPAETGAGSTEELDALIQGERIGATEEPLRRWKWFAGANAAILAVMMVLTGGDGAALLPFILVFSAAGPFVMLAFSKALVRWTHDMRMLDRTAPLEGQDAVVRRVVETLAHRAGIDQTPEVGIYESPDMNAFATGATKNDALIAFSSALVEKLDEKQLAAVAAHEVAHIANGDMISMTLLQSVVNVVVLLVSVPFWVYRFIFSDSWLGILCVEVLRFLIRGVFLVGGYLVMMAFSRKREYAADALAASLTSPDAMASALESLGADSAEVPAEQADYACLKISGRLSFAEFLSSHPPIEKRVAALRGGAGAAAANPPQTAVSAGTAGPPPLPAAAKIGVAQAQPAAPPQEPPKL